MCLLRRFFVCKKKDVAFDEIASDRWSRFGIWLYDLLVFNIFVSNFVRAERMKKHYVVLSATQTISHIFMYIIKQNLRNYKKGELQKCQTKTSNGTLLKRRHWRHFILRWRRPTIASIWMFCFSSSHFIVPSCLRVFFSHFFSTIPHKKKVFSWFKILNDFFPLSLSLLAHLKRTVDISTFTNTFIPIGLDFISAFQMANTYRKKIYKI